MVSIINSGKYSATINPNNYFFSFFHSSPSLCNNYAHVTCLQLSHTSCIFCFKSYYYCFYLHLISSVSIHIYLSLLILSSLQMSPLKKSLFLLQCLDFYHFLFIFIQFPSLCLPFILHVIYLFTRALTVLIMVV